MPTTGSAIVVGVDQADRSSAALLWAAAEARRRDAVLRIVHARRPTRVARAPFHHAAVNRAAKRHRQEVGALNRVAAILERVAPDLVVSVEPVEGPPGPVLVDAASGADLLVVGAEPERGQQPPYGSVSRHVVAHAPCEVVVVPEPDPQAVG